MAKASASPGVGTPICRIEVVTADQTSSKARAETAVWTHKWIDPECA